MELCAESRQAAMDEFDDYEPETTESEESNICTVKESETENDWSATDSDSTDEPEMDRVWSELEEEIGEILDAGSTDSTVDDSSTVNLQPTELNSGQFGCPKCPLVSSYWNIKQHIIGHARKRQYSCDICGFSSNSTGPISHHKRIHVDFDRIRFRGVGKKTFVGCSYCPYCPYEHHQEKVILDHLVFHGADYMFRCDFCNYATASLEGIQLHGMVHVNEGGMSMLEMRTLIEEDESTKTDIYSSVSESLQLPAGVEPLRILRVFYSDSAENGSLFGCQVTSPYSNIVLEHLCSAFYQSWQFSLHRLPTKIKNSSCAGSAFGSAF